MNNFAKENMGKWKSFIDRLEIYEKVKSEKRI